jgi:hypothetical protein
MKPANEPACRLDSLGLLTRESGQIALRRPTRARPRHLARRGKRLELTLSVRKILGSSPRITIEVKSKDDDRGQAQG